ncbi:GGDEF domain-containing protein [Geodermatophilus sp. SYSU D00965]
MELPSSLRARNPRASLRSAAVILLVAAATLAGFTSFEDSTGGPLLLAPSWVGVAVLVVAGAVCALGPAERLDRLGAGVLVGLGGVVLQCLLNLVTEDASAAAQAFYAFPVLWAAAHLRVGAVALVVTAAVTADLTTLLLLVPAHQAVTDGVFFGAVLVVMGLVLARAGRTQDRLVAALREQATVDSLTGLANRRSFESAVETALTSRTSHGTGLVLIDVDAFKTINDTYGHPVGDDVLVHLAGVLRRQVRSGDAVLSRLGGDELAVLLPGCTAEAAARRGDQLLAAVHAGSIALADGTELPLSISVGVAHVAHATGDLKELYAAADTALYRAKRAGRGQVAVGSR